MGQRMAILCQVGMVETNYLMKLMYFGLNLFNVILHNCQRWVRGLNVDVGVVEYNCKEEGKNKKKNLEVDFIVNKGSNRYYIQSALNVDTKEKRIQETESLRRTGDSFSKIVIVRNSIVPRYDDGGIFYIGVEDFLLNKISLNL